MAILTASDVGVLILFHFTEPTDRALAEWGTPQGTDLMLGALWSADPAAMMTEGEAA